MDRRQWLRVYGPGSALILIGLVPVGGCGGGSKAPMTGNVVIESEEELAQREAESKALDEEARAEARAKSRRKVKRR
jgi:hypothetical protein